MQRCRPGGNYEPVHGRAAHVAGQRAFLEGMLGRRRIFVTDRYHATGAARARANMLRELEQLATTEGGR